MSGYKSIDLSQVINLGDDWSGQDEALAGSRDKQTYVGHEDGRYYIFKQPKPRREAQIWSELLASFIAGDMLGWPVQHTQIAVRGGQVGNLLRYVFDPHTQSIIPGEQLCKHIDPDFDLEVGTRHTWPLIKQIMDEFLGVSRLDGRKLYRASREYYQYWCRTIAFDTLISNSDRHAENWSFMFREAGSEEDRCPLMAPFYDNASSMGCDVEEIGLNKWFDSRGEIVKSKVNKYAARGRHHLRHDGERYSFQHLATLVLNENLDHRAEYEAIAQLDLSKLTPVFEEIMQMESLPDCAQMTYRRQMQITELLQIGQSRIRQALEDTR